LSRPALTCAPPTWKVLSYIITIDSAIILLLLPFLPCSPGKTAELLADFVNEQPMKAFLAR
jgi:hypothetical protein